MTYFYKLLLSISIGLSLTGAFPQSCLGSYPRQSSNSSIPTQPSSHALYEKAKYAMDTKNYQKAIEGFYQLIQDFPEDKHTELAYRYLIICYDENNQPNEAINMINQFRWRYPDSQYLEQLSHIEGELKYSLDPVYALHKLKD